MRPGRVVLIPGSFNPPTNAHLKIVHELHSRYPGSKIVLVPCNDNYIKEWKKQPNPISMEDRIRLLYGMIDQKYSYVSIFESNKDPYGYLIDTARYYRSIYDDVVICLGADNLEHMDLWKDAETLIQENHFVWFPRNNNYATKCCALVQKYMRHGNHFIIVDKSIPWVSSTMIREAYLNGNWDTVIQSVPENVFLYLRYNDDLF